MKNENVFKNEKVEMDSPRSKLTLDKFKIN